MSDNAAPNSSLSRQAPRQAIDALLPQVHAELHRLAAAYLSRQRPGHTLQPTALINEAYLKLAAHPASGWESRSHFVAVAARAMRFILVDHCRQRGYAKRGGDALRVTFDESLPVAAAARGAELLLLDQKLEELAALDPRKSRIAELRYFGGMSVEETAAALSVSVATIMREWRLTRAWLQRELA
ncbi:MAG TPA: ECF-type sigma factor [Terriglobales bacterium]|jgi:RNA polymerase sigma factor (TIGR02999 family)